MNALKTGYFIAQLRKERNLTQSELAKALFVSDKAISRWETGKGFPNIEILPTISEFFDVTVTEILNGERSVEIQNPIENSAENNLIAVCNEVGTVNRKRKKQLKHLRIALIITSIILVISINVSVITTLMVNEYNNVVGSENCVISPDYRQLEYFGTTYLPIMINENEESKIKPNDIILVNEAQISGQGFWWKFPFSERLYGVDGVENNDIVYLQSDADYESPFYCKEEKYDYYCKYFDNQKNIPDVYFITIYGWNPFEITLNTDAVQYLYKLKNGTDTGRTQNYDYSEIIYEGTVFYGYGGCFPNGTVGQILITADGMLFYPSVSFQCSKEKKYYLIDDEYSKYFIDEIFSKDSEYVSKMNNAEKK